jgi:hypothetical protein
LDVRRADWLQAVTVKPGRPGGIEAGMQTTINPPRTWQAVSWLLRLVAAGILLQTLFFKLTGAEESVYIFSTLGAEPAGRIGSAIVELVASVLLLMPATVTLGAVLAMGVMSGAIVSHLTLLGIEIMGDGGLLFFLALVVFFSSAVVLFLHREELPVVGHYFEAAR